MNFNFSSIIDVKRHHEKAREVSADFVTGE